jgi:hypothetical protein
MNTPDRLIPLRPDRDAAREQSMRSLARACVEVCRTVGGAPGRTSSRDDRVVPLLTRAAQVPTSTTDAAALMTVAMHFIETLVPVSAAAQVIARSLGLSFDNATQLSVPAVAIPAAKFVGQGKPIPVVQGETTSMLIDPYKIAVIVVVTGEMIRNTQAEAIIRQTLIETTAASLDGLLFSIAAGVADERPPGLLYDIPPLDPTDAGADAMANDLKQLARAIAPVSGSGTPLLIAAPEQFVSLSMLVHDVFPFAMSAALPAGTVIAVVPEGICTVIELPRVEAGAHMVTNMDSTPGEIVDIGGTFARPVGSVFQTDGVGLRLVMPATWGLRSPNAIAWLQSVNW